MDDHSELRMSTVGNLFTAVDFYHATHVGNRLSTLMSLKIEGRVHAYMLHPVTYPTRNGTIAGNEYSRP